MKLLGYSEYKDSKVDWLGNIPVHWGVARVKDVLKYSAYGISESTKEDGNFEILTMGDIFEGTITYPQKRFVDYIPPELLLSKGDILYTRTNGSISLIGKAGLVKTEVSNISFASYLVLLRLRCECVSEYFNFLFNAEQYLDKVRSVAITTAQNNLSLSSYKQLLIPQLSHEEQCDIVAYLQCCVQRIEKKKQLLLEKKKRYLELRNSLIHETICNGIGVQKKNHKDSQVEWIGEIPANWEIRRLKDIFVERKEKNMKLDGSPVTENILSVMKDVGVINYDDKGNVGNKKSEDITGYKLVYKRDIVVNKMNVLIGSVGISKEFGALSVIYIVLKTKKGFLPEYYDYVFRSKYFQKYLRTISTGILEIRECVNSVLFAHQELPSPPLEEQREIAKYLNEKTRKIDNIIGNLKRQIELLIELRKTLINDVVIGKLKVE